MLQLPLYSLEQIRRLPNVRWVYLNSSFEKLKPILKEFRQLEPNASIRYELHKNGKDGYSVWDAFIVFENKGKFFRIWQDTIYGKNCFQIAVDYSDLEHINMNSLHSAHQALELYPPVLYKLTRDGVDQWINYLSKFRIRLENINEKNRIKKEEVLKVLNSLPDVKWDKEMKSGYIRRNGIYYSFEITPGYIAEKVHVDIEPEFRTINSFLMLSDNRFKY